MKFIFVDRVVGSKTKETCINCEHIVFITEFDDKTTNIIVSDGGEILCKNTIEEILNFIDQSEDL